MNYVHLQLFLFKEIILMIYIFKYEDYEKQINFFKNTREDYEKQINFFKNTRMVIING